MSNNYSQGFYNIKHPEKYIGQKVPKYRSSWEMTFFMFCDNNPAVLQWASESITIPYRNPLTGKHTIYVPDVFVVYQNKNGQKVAELIEIKPLKQTSLTEAKTTRDKAHAIINMAKWESASKWCKKNGIRFRVISEKDIFFNGRK